jgi:hypothetical protein
MGMSPHLSGHPGNEMEGLAEAPAGVPTAGRKMIAMESSMTVDSRGMVGHQFLVLHVCKQHISLAGLNKCEVGLFR